MSLKRFIFLDVLSMLIILIPILGSYGTAFYLYQTFGLLSLPLWPFAMVFALCLIFLVIRLLSPKMKKGVYEIGVNSGYMAFYINLSLLRSLKCSGLDKMIFSIGIFRYLTFKALGAKIPYRFVMAVNTEMADFPLIEMGKNVYLGDRSKLFCHLINKDKLMLKPIYLAEDTQVMAGAVIKPGTKTNQSDILRG